MSMNSRSNRITISKVNTIAKILGDTRKHIDPLRAEESYKTATFRSEGKICRDCIRCVKIKYTHLCKKRSDNRTVNPLAICHMFEEKANGTLTP